MDYSTKQVSSELVDEVVDALKNIRGWGSVEIFVQYYRLVQITERNIKKTTNGDRKKTKQGLDKVRNTIIYWRVSILYSLILNKIV